MFTGIVEEAGTVVAVAPGGDPGGSDGPGAARTPDARLTVRGPLVTSDVAAGDSIAVAGVCLTVADLPEPGVFVADVMPETLSRSALGALRPGDRVNLERALPSGGRLGGHIVQGHVDGVGEVARVEPGERWTVLRILADPAVLRYVAEKGSIAIDGVSLTVTGVDAGGFGVALIPTTLAATTLGGLRPGARVNLEVDVIAKYVERLMTAGAPAAATAPEEDA